jgi:hypothetical protein
VMTPLILCFRSWGLFWASSMATTLIWPTGNSVATAEAAVISSTEEYTADATLRTSVHSPGRRLTLTKYSAFSTFFKTVFYIVVLWLIPVLS